MSANQVLGMMPAPAGRAASAASPSPGGSISAAEAFRRHGAEGGGGFSLPGAPAARPSSRAEAAQIIYAAMRLAALANLPAPSSKALAPLIGAKSYASVLTILAELVADGRITVVSRPNYKIVSCSKGEWSTAAREPSKVISAPPPASGKRSRPPRQWTEEENNALRAVAAGKMPLRRFCAERCIPLETARYRMGRIGLAAPRKDRAHAPGVEIAEIPRPSDGWIPIAHGNNGKWREYEGAPIGITAARIAVSAGRATMAQRRIDGGFDLLFRVLRA